MVKLLALTLAFALTAAAKPHHGHGHGHGHGHKDHSAGFVTIASDGSGFVRDGKPYYIQGANYWQAMNLGADDCNGGDRKRLETEIKQLAALGINNLRLMASSEGPDDQPYRMRPSLMPKPGVYNEAVFRGLDYALDLMGQYNMTAVMTLQNFWHWSGGFSQYVAWVTGNQTIPYPGDWGMWDEFTKFSARFYNDSSIVAETQKLYKDHIATVINRWQHANEPQEGPGWWFEETANFIKEHAPKQLITAGLESKLDQYDFNRTHDHKNIDYTTCHLWVENWGIYNPANESSIVDAKAYAKTYIQSRSQWAAALDKPIVMEEFGMARDAFNKPNDPVYKYDPNTPTTHKDEYYGFIFDEIVGLAKERKFSGSNFWAYSGVGRSTDYPNKYGMVWLGDPPHEHRGWYGVYDKDESTLEVIKSYNKRLAGLE
ncbi:glycoside hydrolase superfamily [Dichotomocladium elegans]|nr:glycoside hydrolase superfamily [Dichotomocladium elegans]